MAASSSYCDGCVVWGLIRLMYARSTHTRGARERRCTDQFFRWTAPASGGRHGQSAGVRMPAGDKLAHPIVARCARVHYGAKRRSFKYMNRREQASQGHQTGDQASHTSISKTGGENTNRFFFQSRRPYRTYPRKYFVSGNHILEICLRTVK